MATDSSDQKQDLLLDLNFVPQWARKPAGANPYENAEQSRPKRRSDDRRHGGGRSGGSRDARSQSSRGEHPPRREGGQGGGDRSRSRVSRPSRPPQEPIQELPIDIHFIPERQHLGAFVRRIRSHQRAYPLMDLAGLFLTSAENYLLKIEVRRGKDVSLRFYQCDCCKAVFTEEQNLKDHVLSAHLTDFFDSEEIEGDAPAGNYVCVGRCGLSGELLGPPNYHGFDEKIKELIRTKYPNMTFEAYRAKVEMLREPEAVEQWKEAARKQTVYRLKKMDAVDETTEEAEESTESMVMTFTEAKAYFLEHLMAPCMHNSTKVLLSSEAGQLVGDRSLQYAVRKAWNRENRHPFTLSIALRPAFKHMKLHLFKAGNITFVTSVKPRPVDPARTVDAIRKALEYLQEHPGCTRKELAEGLSGDETDMDKINDAMNSLRWLIERGHVIEFFNGTLSVPSSIKSGRKKRTSSNNKKTEPEKTS